MDGLAPQCAGNPDQPSVDLEDDRVYLVPYRWFREAQELSPDAGGNVGPLGSRGILYTASSASPSYGGPMKLIDNLFNSDLVFNLQREEESRQNDDGADGGGGFSSRSYALIRTDIWLQTLKWHNDLNTAMKGGGNFSVSEYAADVYALMLRISVVRETNIMTVKISKRDNTVEYYKRASKIFTADSEPIRIWDFSGQTTLIFMNERNKLHGDCQHPLDQEILLELHVYALTEVLTSRTEGKKDDLVVQQSKKAILSNGDSIMSNGSIGSTDSGFIHANARAFSGVGSLGLTGLENLGNTCFMNSAIQCLAHTPKLVDFFLGNYYREINQQNPLGMDGELALAFGDLLRKLWAPDRTPVIPRPFKTKLGYFAPQFSGFNQHDSQELLAFLLDGLHEDLNRVKCKPYIEAKDAPDRSDEEVANEYWANHLARNDSIIVDLFQGQFRSTLVCPACDKVSVTFDPFMYLSLPLPSTMMRTMTVTVFSTDGSAKPSPYTVTVPKYGKCKDLVQSLSIACSLRDDESLLVAEVYSNSIIRYLEEPSDSLSLLRDGDSLAAYRMAKDTESLPLVVFLHQRMEEQYIYGKMTSHWKLFGVPLVTRLSGIPNGSTIQNLFLKLLGPFQKVGDASLDDQDNGENSSLDNASKIDLISPRLESEGTIDASDDGTYHMNELQYFLTDARGQMKKSKIEMSEEISVTGLQKQLHLLVCWPEKMVEQYDLSLLYSLPEIYKSGFLLKWPQDSVSLYACLEAFLKEEPLGPEDMWYCPCCKMHQQATKKLDLWRLPEVLVIHLKRFSYSRFMKNKLETFVDFPIHDFDLSTYIAYETGQSSYHYELFAMSNHYGNMGGGHYTAYVHHEGEDRWYDFDDRYVIPKPEDSIKTSAAYVLFYRRVPSKSDA